ncbi:MAG: hypothetical protein GC199_00780 [Alphaproteobacteria bacterium]|nr:hypothetical protein [Alphaproteobacteria bacterium]
MTDSIEAVLLGFAAYGGVGAAFAILFLTFGVARVDPAAQGTSTAFRLLILPGVVALWPLLLVRWLTHRAEDA